MHTIVFNIEDPPEVQLIQLRYWFHFLQSRIPPVEPLGLIFFYIPNDFYFILLYRNFSNL